MVAEITYDVRGRRESITHAANSTTTSYSYDPLNFRLRAIETTRASDSKKLQGLHYHHDPVGNVTDIRDDAQQTVYFQNAIVEAANSYTYDALYRLVEATGREHATQGTAQRSSTQLLPDSSAVPMANDPNALRRYTQSYTYDAVGNLETVVHAPASGTGWTRRYQYREDGNRLVGTSAPGDSAGALYTNTATYSHTYPHDEHGNFTAMPHMSTMAWDELDQLHHCTVGSQEVYFQFAGGQRVRKYVEHAGATTEERIYLGSFELYRKRVNGALVNGTLKEEWESLHVSDDTGRILLVETHTVDDGDVVGSPTGIWRFQLSNHLGSAATEVSETGAVISYEEYHPYGTSAYRLVDSQIDVPAKRYRYTGMERDEETGLGYHTARYYAPWLGRWTASDPIGLSGGINRFAYVNGSPVQMTDVAGTNEDEPTIWVPETDAPVEITVQTQPLSPADIVGHLFPGSGDTTPAERSWRDRLGYHLGVAIELRERAVDATVEALEAGKELYDNADDAGLAVGTLANELQSAISTESGRLQIGASLAEGFLSSIDKGIVAIDDYQEAAAKGDVEAGADAAIDVGEGALSLSIVANPAAATARLTTRATNATVRAARTRRAVAQATRGESVAGGAAAERAAVRTAGREAAASRGAAASAAGGAVSPVRPAVTNAGHAYAKALYPGGSGRAFAGHGELRLGAGNVTVPEGTSLTFYSKHGKSLTDRAGRRVERGSRFGLRRYKFFPGDRVPNYTLKPPDGLKIRQNSITVATPTPLSDLLVPNMGDLDWAACRVTRL
ncbi:RHS repeat-associated core domain-containing protein [Enhygromyxa salina]|uniref:RHS repeat-associated core domain-containing protein n=1 Tax=Enhygromyxa salina TaxID=215803 RepID=UPI001FD4C878|nr:RHS repeat-associated core domain-containing protein [Enhygromyxa salina]